MAQIKRKSQRRLFLSLVQFSKKLLTLFKQPIFLALTLFGNTVIMVSASLFYFLERGSNPHVHSFLDTLWWSVSTVTTVGYGDVIPLTPIGRIVGIATMIIGTALFWSFTALFAEAMLSRELSEIDERISDIQNVVDSIKTSDSLDRHETKELIGNLESHLQSMKRSLKL